MSSFDKKINSIKISLIDIKAATDNFADENIIRQGGHRKIYKGRLLRSEKWIDIVALCFDSKSWRGRKEFMTEIVMLCSLKHQNLASIVGFCEEEDEKIIISKFEAKGSLDQYLSDPVTLTWTQRLHICLGVARALSYVHYDKKRNFSLIHTNVKSSKILLDDNWEPKLSGFELSKMQPVARRQGIVLDRLVSGTGAYVDPAFVKSGGVTHKSDVYSLGVVLFEVLCGRKAFVQTSKHVEPEETVPPTLSGVYDYIIRESMTHIQARKHEMVAGSFSRMDTASFAQMQPPSFPPSIGVMKPPSIGAMNLPSWGEIQNVMQPLSFLAVAEKPPSIGYVRGSYNFSEEEKYMITMKSLEHLHMPEDGLLAKLAKSHYENKTLDDIIHPDLRKQMNDLSLNKFTEAAYFCLKEKRAQRPNIDRVIYALNKALALQLHHENSLVLSEHSTVEVEGTTINHWKGGDLEHLKIELDAIESAKKCLIGKGGYGSVYKTEIDSTVIPLYKAELPKRSITVAIKEIIYREDKQGEQGFFAELEILSGCRHPNIVTLLGFCYEPPRMILVYEYVSNGSLEDYLGSEAKMTNLTWVQRLKICIDIACGLNYIHSTIDNKQKIIHRDIKSANVLLGENWEAKIADFGLSIFHPLNHLESTIQATKIAGTNTYLDPEYESTGKLKKASDVYSFGVVLFEILTGRFAFEWVTKDNERGLAPVVQQLFKSKGTLKEMVDPKLREESDGKGYTLSRGPNKDSLHIFSKIGCLCLSEKQDQRPTMEVVIKELKKALEFQEYHTDGLRISLEDIKTATQDFKISIGKGGFGTVYRGEIFHDKGVATIVAKRNDMYSEQGEQEFLTELEILSEYRHNNIISLLGYCDEEKERISVFEYASNGSLDRHVDNASLTWTERIKIGIDVARGLDFLHVGGSTQASVIHRDIKSANILLDGNWKAKISDFGLSKITAINNEMDFMIDDACGTPGYVDPQYVEQGFFTRKSDIYSLGVVLFEIMCGRTAFLHGQEDLVHLVKRHYEDGKLFELVFRDIKNTIVPESLTAYVNIAYECLHNEREKRPDASTVVIKLREALGFQVDIEVWEAKRPKDYKEIIQLSKTPKIYSNVSNKVLCEMFSKGILLQSGKACLSVNDNGETNEMVSATMFSYENNRLHKRISIKKSRFQRVVKIMDISNLKTRIKIRTQFLSPNLIYGAHLVFKFCDPRKFPCNLMYVNLKYQMGNENLNSYFATYGDDEWMMIELCRFIPHKKDVVFEVLLERLSRYYCGSGAIYLEGIHFRVISDAILKVKPEGYEKLKGVERDLKSNSNSNSVQQVSVDYDVITQLEDGEKLFSLSKANGKKWYMLSAKMVLYESSDVKCYNWKALDESESRFQEVAELLSHQVFRIKCKIETQKLSADTDYACYLVFKLSQKCHGLQCPVKVRDVLLRKNKESTFLYFRTPRAVNLHNIERVPKPREDGLMEVIVWEFNSGKNDHVPMSLKLRCYEGTMSGLIVHGIEFRPL